MLRKTFCNQSFPWSTMSSMESVTAALWSWRRLSKIKNLESLSRSPMSWSSLSWSSISMTAVSRLSKSKCQWEKTFVQREQFLDSQICLFWKKKWQKDSKVWQLLDKVCNVCQSAKCHREKSLAEENFCKNKNVQFPHFITFVCFFLVIFRRFDYLRHKWWEKSDLQTRHKYLIFGGSMSPIFWLTLVPNSVGSPHLKSGKAWLYF